MNILLTIYRRLGLLRYKLSRNETIIVIWAGLMLIVIGTFVYAWLEGWSLLDALYATIITITTVGYGDFSPQTAYGRLFAIFFTLIAIGIGSYGISVLAAYMIEKQSTKLERILRKRKMERIAALNQHYIICGSDFVGMRIARDYKLAQIPFILIDASEERLKQTLLMLIPYYYQHRMEMLLDVKDVDLSQYEEQSISELAETAEVPFLLADPTDDHVLWQAGIERAAGLAATLPDDRDNLSIVIGARALTKRLGNDGLRIMARVEQLQNVRKLYFSGADAVRAPATIGGAEMALHLAHPEISKWWQTRLRHDAEPIGYHQVIVGTERPSWVGKNIADIYAAEGILFMAVKRGDDYISPPLPTTTLQKDDVAITFGHLDA